jgi:hypothetical protein
MGEQGVDTRNDLDIVDDLEENLRICRGIVRLMVHQDEDEGAHLSEIAPVVNDLDNRLQRIHDDHRELLERSKKSEKGDNDGD